MERMNNLESNTPPKVSKTSSSTKPRSVASYNAKNGPSKKWAVTVCTGGECSNVLGLTSNQVAVIVSGPPSTSGLREAGMTALGDTTECQPVSPRDTMNDYWPGRFWVFDQSKPDKKPISSNGIGPIGIDPEKVDITKFPFRARHKLKLLPSRVRGYNRMTEYTNDDSLLETGSEANPSTRPRSVTNYNKNNGPMKKWTVTVCEEGECSNILGLTPNQVAVIISGPFPDLETHQYWLERLLLSGQTGFQNIADFDTDNNYWPGRFWVFEREPKFRKLIDTEINLEEIPLLGFATNITQSSICVPQSNTWERGRVFEIMTKSQPLIRFAIVFRKKSCRLHYEIGSDFDPTTQLTTKSLAGLETYESPLNTDNPNQTYTRLLNTLRQLLVSAKISTQKATELVSDVSKQLPTANLSWPNGQDIEEPELLEHKNSRARTIPGYGFKKHNDKPPCEPDVEPGTLEHLWQDYTLSVGRLYHAGPLDWCGYDHEFCHSVHRARAKMYDNGWDAGGILFEVKYREKLKLRFVIREWDGIAKTHVAHVEGEEGDNTVWQGATNDHFRSDLYWTSQKKPLKDAYPDGHDILAWEGRAQWLDTIENQSNCQRGLRNHIPTMCQAAKLPPHIGNAIASLIDKWLDTNNALNWPNNKEQSTPHFETHRAPSKKPEKPGSRPDILLPAK